MKTHHEMLWVIWTTLSVIACDTTAENSGPFGDGLAEVSLSAQTKRPKLQESACGQVPYQTVALWRGDDSEKSAIDADIMNGSIPMVSKNDAYSKGKVGRAFDFTQNVRPIVKTKGSISIGDAFGGPDGDELTLMAWIKSDQTGSKHGRIIEMGSHQRDSTAIVLDRSGQIRGWIHAGGARQGVVSSSGAGPQENHFDYFLSDQFHHVAMTYDGTYVRLFIDGKLKDEKRNESSSKLIDSPRTVLIGRHDYNNPGSRNGWGDFGGWIDEVMVVRRALSASEVVQIVGADSAGVCLDCYGGVNDADGSVWVQTTNVRNNTMQTIEFDPKTVESRSCTKHPAGAPEKATECHATRLRGEVYVDGYVIGIRRCSFEF